MSGAEFHSEFNYFILCIYFFNKLHAQRRWQVDTSSSLPISSAFQCISNAFTCWAITFRAPGYMFSCAWHLLHFKVIIPALRTSLHVFSRLELVHMFSRDWRRLQVFPRLAPVTRFWLVDHTSRAHTDSICKNFACSFATVKKTAVKNHYIQLSGCYML